MKCAVGWPVSCATWHPRCAEAELQSLLDVLTEEREALDAERALADELAAALEVVAPGPATQWGLARREEALARHTEARRG